MKLLRARKPKLSIDLAPLIDVVFQLLVFFMLTSTFANPSMKMVLPSAHATDENIPQKIVVSIDAAGALTINANKTTFSEFKLELENVLTSLKKKTVHIKGDKDMPYHYFVEIMDLAKQAGATQINIVHQKKE